MADDQLEEYKLLASVPPIQRLESGRQIDKPYNKMGFWGGNEKTWHLRYPEMTQLQFDMFKQAAKAQKEEFAPGKSSLWDLALKYFPSRSKAPTVNVSEYSAVDETKTTLRHVDRKAAEGNEWDVPPTAPSPEEDSLPDTLPLETQQIIVPVLPEEDKKRAVGVLESSSGSIVSGISVPVKELLVSWGRGPENTVVYESKSETRVPKYAFKVVLWKDGLDPSKWRMALPWDKSDEGNGYTFYLSTKATSGVTVNGHALPSHDCRNPLSHSRNWVPIYNGDEIVVWGMPTDTAHQTKVTFRCFWGDSAKHRPADSPPKIVSSTTARKIDEACIKAYKHIRHQAEFRRQSKEADKDYEERVDNIESERDRSRLFEAKRLEAVRFLSQRNVSRRGSPASAPATTTLRGQTPKLGLPSPLQENRTLPK